MAGGQKRGDVTVSAWGRLPPGLAASMATLDQASLDELALTPEQLVEFTDRFCAESDVDRWVVAVAGDAVVGMLLTYRREIRFDGRAVVLGGIGSVYVASAWRGCGIARRLVTTAMLELARAGCDVVFLCANLDDAQLLRLYGGAGFVALGREYAYLGASGRRYAGLDGMLAPVGSPDLFARVMDASEPFEIGRGNW